MITLFVTGTMQPQPRNPFYHLVTYLFMCVVCFFFPLILKQPPAFGFSGLSRLKHFIISFRWDTNQKNKRFHATSLIKWLTKVEKNYISKPDFSFLFQEYSLSTPNHSISDFEKYPIRVALHLTPL